MKDVVGSVRKVDRLGRVVIPKEMRDQLGIKEGSEVSFMIRSDYATLKPIKSLDQCFHCGNVVSKNDNFCSRCGVILQDK